MAPRAFLIDGTACCYRAFHAIRSLSTSDGRATNAVYGVATMLQALLQKEHPDYFAVAFDVGKPTFRHKQFEAYKIQRKPMPDGLIGQLPTIKTLLAAYRIPMFEREGYEAEDVLATIAKQLVAEGIKVFLVTGDKDLLQLVTNDVAVYDPMRDHGTVLDAAAVTARYGVAPEQVVEVMALMGDEIDNIPGVRGIGQKTASQLIQRFGSVAQLYARLDEVHSPAQRSRLEDSREQVQLARALARIDAAVPMTVRAEELKVREPDWPALRALLRELEFKKMLHAVDEHAPAPAGPDKTVHVVKTERQMDALQALLRGADRAGTILAGEEVPRAAERAADATAIMCWPTCAEHGEAAQESADAVVLALAVDGQEAWVLRLDRRAAEQTPWRGLVKWLADPSARKIGHDLKTATRRLARLGLSLEGLSGDTMIAAYLLNPARTEQRLTDLTDEYLSLQLREPFQAVTPRAHGAQIECPAELSGDAAQACGRAVCVVPALHATLWERLQAAQMTSLYTDLELPLVTVLARMEQTGIAVDVPYLASLHASMRATLERLTQDLYRLAGAEFNLNSPKQLAQVLFERLKLPVIKRTKTGPSTDSEVLGRLAAQHPLPKLLMDYRELSKLVSTYVEALPKLVNPQTGRIHTSLNQTATATGRLSSSEPNLQNIPIKTELGRQIRKAFIPGEAGWVLVAADYSQIELRILAHLCGDERLREAFAAGQDIHRRTASLIYRIPEAEVTPEMRSATKVTNFGIIYGMSAHGLSRELGIPHEEATAFMDAYFQHYPKVRAFFDTQMAQAQRDGYVHTLLGRRRYLPEVNSPDPMIRQLGQRLAVNTPIQGTAADLIKRAMVQLDAQLSAQHLRSRMLLPVHDELIFEAPAEEVERVVRLVRQVMEGAIQLIVPLTVTVKTGPNWLDLT